MGVKGLMQLLKENTPGAIKQRMNNDFINKRIAIDASILLYQFMTTITDQSGNQLVNEQGEPTSHLVGIISKLTKYYESGIKPVFVFDGQAQDIKNEELERRKQTKIMNEQKAQEALDRGDQQEYQKLIKRTVRVKPEQIEQTTKLLDFLGVTYIKAPREAESLCVALNKANIVYAVASHDMDCLAYGTPRMIRNLADSKIQPIEISYNKVLEQLQISEDQFIDLCLLLGCDYVDNIKNIGPKKALELIKKYQNIENIVQQIKNITSSKSDKPKYEVQDDYLDKVKRAREVFHQECRLTDEEDQYYSNIVRTQKPINKQGAIDFLVKEMQFDQEMAQKRIERLFQKKSQKKQTTITSFLH